MSRKALAAFFAAQLCFLSVGCSEKNTTDILSTAISATKFSYQAGSGDKSEIDLSPKTIEQSLRERLSARGDSHSFQWEMRENSEQKNSHFIVLIIKVTAPSPSTTEVIFKQDEGGITLQAAEQDGCEITAAFIDEFRPK